MKKYRIVTERPHLENAVTEKMMDFEEVLLRANRAKQYKLALKTIIALSLASSLLFFIIYLMKPSPNQQEIPEGAAVVDNGERIAVGIDSSNAVVEKRPNAISAHPEQHVKENYPGEHTHDDLAREKDGNKNVRKRESAPSMNTFVQAAPVEGFQNLYSYFNENLLFPDSLQLNKNEGKVIVEFTVDRRGKIIDLKVTQTLHPVLDSIAMACVQQMPDWKPAMLNDDSVDTRHSIPLIYQLENE